jgi:hypothetical protein
VGRPAILKKNLTVSPSSILVVELKNNATLGKDWSLTILFQRLSKSTLLLSCSSRENGILCIKYSIPELIWYEQNSEGDHYIKPFKGKAPSIESWTVLLSLDDPLRQEIKDETIKKRDHFLDVLISNKVESLPRLTGLAKKLKSKFCPFIEKCWISDGGDSGSYTTGDRINSL